MFFLDITGDRAINSVSRSATVAVGQGVDDFTIAVVATDHPTTCDSKTFLRFFEETFFLSLTPAPGLEREIARALHPVHGASFACYHHPGGKNDRERKGQGRVDIAIALE